MTLNCRPAALRRRCSVSAAVVGVLCGAALAAAPRETDALLLQVGRIDTLAGDSLGRGGMILVRDGKIVAIGAQLDVPDGARRLEFPEAVITPGLIDANCMLDFEVPQSPAPQRFAELGLSLNPPQPGLWAEVAETLHDSAEHGAEGHTCGPGCAGPQGAAAVAEAYSAGPSVNLTWAEHSSEVVPHRHVMDSVNLLSSDFERLLRGGVTTVFVAPDSANVIGARGAIVKTGGPLDRRIVRRADAVKATIGVDPIRRGAPNTLPPTWGPPSVTFYARRPMTRMGVEWVFRKALHDARGAAEGLTPRGADAPSAPALSVLQEVLAGRVPLRIQARTQKDIFTALRIAREFGLHFTLEEGLEAYACVAELKSAGVPVVYGPLMFSPQGWRRFSGEANDLRLNAPRRLLDAGVPLALSAQEFRDEEGLVRQAMFATRYGLTRAEALHAVTAAAAQLLNLPDGYGTLRPGGPADLVVWSGDPLSAESRPLLVLIDGRKVFEDK